VAQHRLDHGSAERLDAAGGIDVGNGKFGARATLGAREGDEAGYGMDEADAYRSGLGAQHGRKAGNARGKGAGAGRKQRAAVDARTGTFVRSISHDFLLSWLWIGTGSLRPPSVDPESCVIQRMPSFAGTRRMDISRR